ncbi:bifunctional 23S rRNA (guanine(2069)-N(7))-methyltransferase RlmK/23S rRNA (guanine(2445)-N(2))-methyltransferase RlmL [Neorhodopirellula pilleata]|uniref:Ribosomal RNA large subunit methyltransferase K n=1 Tax=Neorhodopirellula pilleata TaxID=2714738 RepID=A0A5C6A8L6_9BACT|nr:bifunctional 23S rRNA (guanine(2069)-N(7))-methyltransferase RlmK/23S rRNA (guanine(2445)-N(2))-methyltransferase RlmL [Neorhodopirellula pilleata]TWT95737.1 Ribosomal RNA large subunit methyltransferase K [Neorhodopirellula pilleata]
MTQPPTDPTLDLIAICAFGLEAIVKRELAALGIDALIGESGRVHFRGTFDTIAQTNLWLRCADRVSIRVAEFPAADFDALFETTKAIRWDRWIPVDGSFPVTGRSVKSTLTSVPACQRAVKKAIVEALQRDHATNELPETGAEFKVDIAILKDTATLTLDTTGRGLHRRGYRADVTSAPLKETLAAALIQLTYWRRDRPLIDPFCGSGTIPIEAAMIGRNMAPGQHRSFAFETWPGVQREPILKLREEALQGVLEPLPQRLLGTDINPRILKVARDNAERAGVTADVHFEPGDVRDLQSKRRFGCLVTNPPYGMRLGRDWEVEELYAAIPNVLRHLPTWSFYFLTAFENFENAVGRQADRRRKLYNGRIECTYYQFQGPKPVVGSGTIDEATPETPATTTDEDPTTPEIDSPEPEIDSPETDDPQTPAESEPVVRSPWEAAKARSIANAEPSITEKMSGGDFQSPVSQTSTKSQRYVHAVGEAAFGSLPEKAQHQAELFASRLRKRAKHLRRWPTKRGITCFRLYERDIPEIPLVVDRYENHLHLSEFERPHDRDPAQHANWLDLMAQTAGETLDIPKQNVYLKKRIRQRGNTQHQKVDQTEQRIPVQEGGLTFLVNLADYVDTGLFLDHRVTRSMVRAEATGKHFLNLFAYTGSFTVYAAAGGAASTTSVDLSSNYMQWAEENLRANDLQGPQHQFVPMHIGEFIRRHKPGEVYDLVVCDPPTFSNSKRTDEDWNVQTDAVPLLINVLKLVRPGGVIYFSNNFRRFKFDTEALEGTTIREISAQTVPEDYRNRRIHRCWRIVKETQETKETP